MATAQRMTKNLYRDSVSLMQFSEELRALDGIQQALAVMATIYTDKLFTGQREMRHPVTAGSVEGLDNYRVGSTPLCASRLLCLNFPASSFPDYSSP